MMCTVKGQKVYLSGEKNQLYTCTSSDVFTSSKRKYIVEEIMPIARSYFQHALQVVPVSGKLILTSRGGYDPATKY